MVGAGQGWKRSERGFPHLFLPERHPGESRDLRIKSHGGSLRGPGFRRDDGQSPLPIFLSSAIRDA
jgi:hypothetical protein